MNDFQNGLIRDIMQTEIRTIAPDATARTALGVMSDSGMSCLIVEPGDPSQGIGILTQKDLVAAVFDRYDGLDNARVSELMTSPSVTIPPDFTIGTSVAMMRNTGIRRVPVVEDGKLVGIVSLTDVFRRAAATLLACDAA